jgi:hypothetical protein
VRFGELIGAVIAVVQTALGAGIEHPLLPPSDSTGCPPESGLEFGAVPGDPVVLLAYFVRCA